MSNPLLHWSYAMPFQHPHELLYAVRFDKAVKFPKHIAFLIKYHSRQLNNPNILSRVLKIQGNMNDVSGMQVIMSQIVHS